MLNVHNVSNKLTLKNVTHDDDITAYYFTCNEQVTCAGEDLWNYTTEGQVVNVTGVNVFVTRYDGDTAFVSVNAELAEDVLIYTDAGFASAISALVNCDVDYTELGMQDYAYVSMEV